jgi:hypothetical protein
MGCLILEEEEVDDDADIDIDIGIGTDDGAAGRRRGGATAEAVPYVDDVVPDVGGRRCRSPPPPESCSRSRCR